MNLRDLEYLIKTAELKHFGKAADACNVTQSTLSIQIRKLEETLGVDIFERTNRMVMLTPVGERIVAHAQKALREVEHMRNIARAAKDPLSGELKLGAFPTLAPYLFPKLVPEVRSALPRLQLVLIEEKTEKLLAMLREGSIDCALLALPIDEPGLTVHPVFDEPFSLAVPATHTFARRKRVNLDDIKDETILLLDEGHCLRNQSLELCERIGTGESMRYRATSLEVLRNMVAANSGITFMPQLAIPKERSTHVAYIPFTAPAPSRQIGLVVRDSDGRNTLFDKLAAAARKSVE